MASNPSHVCMFANAQSPHCSWVRMPAQHWLLHCSISFYHIYDPSNNVHLLFTPVHQKIVDYRTCSSNSPLSLSLSLSWLNFCVHLFKLFLSVPVFLPVIILYIYIYIRIYIAIDRERKFTRGTIDKIQRRVVRKVETGKYTMRVFFPSLGRPRAHPSKLRLLFHFALK